MPTKEYYIQYRNMFLSLGKYNEVEQLDYHYKLVFLFNKHNKLIKIL